MGRKRKTINENLDPSLPLDNSRWEQFCMNMVSGTSMGDAYLNAGYKMKGNNGASVNANVLLKNTKIANRIAYLKKRKAESFLMSADEILRDLKIIWNLNIIEVMENPKKYGQYIQRIKLKILDGKQVISDLQMVSKEQMIKLLGQNLKLFAQNINLEFDELPFHELLAKKIIGNEDFIDKLFKDEEPESD